MEYSIMIQQRHLLRPIPPVVATTQEKWYCWCRHISGWTTTTSSRFRGRCTVSATPSRAN